MNKFQVGDLVTPKKNAESLFHGKIGIVTTLFSEHIVLVDFGVKIKDKNVTAAVMAYALEKVIAN